MYHFILMSLVELLKRRKIFFILVGLFVRCSWTSEIKCFEEHLDCQQKEHCRHDQPSTQTQFNVVPSSNALLLCTWTCSNDSQCLAFNFFSSSGTCQMYNNPSENCFYAADNCFHMTSTAVNVFYRTITIHVDFTVESLYFDGVQQDLTSSSSYRVCSDTRVIALHASNYANAKFVEVISDDRYILTDTTWKCLPSTPALDGNNRVWYNPDYDDESWLPAVNQDPAYSNFGALKIWSKDDSIAYCRKRFCG
ncbi:hypothetical protein HELRODRAFT_183525 [Helobdella robusta]|uniref:Apple domain-containing protein n=1 Tax=Helobdella robusta TaxID=6412 RepID=T1FJS5_HELRO|nr:hypothetical protein HELRODRAFT_183525 [Helobdella robusta]ESO10495.1 hypothetical protein HELRODRAFT_183525 [Helobdella robusta]